jgi:hypothetical protein
MKLLLLFISSALALAPQAAASISLIITADRLKTADGRPMDYHGLWLLVASTVDGSFAIDGLNGPGDRIVAGSSTALGSIIGGSDDLVVARGSLNDFAIDGVIDWSSGVVSYQAPVYGGAASKWSAGDPLALLWFPELTPAHTVVATGIDYGFYTSAVANPEESRPWVSPIDPTSAYYLGLFTRDGDVLSPGPAASNPASAGNASLEVIPEPSALLLALLAASMWGMRRVRQR